MQPGYQQSDSRRASVFFIVEAQTHLWWGVQGRRNPRRVFVAGIANPVRLTTLRFATEGGDYPLQQR